MMIDQLPFIFGPMAVTGLYIINLFLRYFNSFNSLLLVLRFQGREDIHGTFVRSGKPGVSGDRS